MNGEAEPQLRDNIDSKDGFFDLCSQCDIFPWWVLIGAILSSPSKFLCFALSVGSSRLVIGSVASR